MFQSAYDGWYQDANGEWYPAEDSSATSSSAQPAKAANGSVVKSAAAAESNEANATSKASTQVNFLVVDSLSRQSCGGSILGC